MPTLVGNLINRQTYRQRRAGGVHECGAVDPWSGVGAWGRLAHAWPH